MVSHLTEELLIKVMTSIAIGGVTELIPFDQLIGDVPMSENDLYDDCMQYQDLAAGTAAGGIGAVTGALAAPAGPLASGMAAGLSGTIAYDAVDNGGWSAICGSAQSGWDAISDFNEPSTSNSWDMGSTSSSSDSGSC